MSVARPARGAPGPNARDDRYKVVEVSPVGEETLERALNDGSRDGFAFQSVHFVMREGSHRPALAYLFFTRSEPEA